MSFCGTSVLFVLKPPYTEEGREQFYTWLCEHTSMGKEECRQIAITGELTPVLLSASQTSVQTAEWADQLEAMDQWNGCKCTICGKVRDTEHQWKSCRCLTCGKTRNQGHSLNKCMCTVCHTAMPVWMSDVHLWNGCKCTVCGQVQDEDHEWEIVYDKSCNDCPYQPISVEDLNGSSCYEADGCAHFRCKICGKETETQPLHSSPQ